VFFHSSGVIRNVLVYDLNGRFDRVVPSKAGLGGWGDASGSLGDVGIGGKAVEAVTRWKLLGSSTKPSASLVSLNLETGSKHQLRIHLSKVLNAPVLGDPLYSNDRHSYLGGVSVPRGQYLHASHVAFHSYRQSGPHKRFKVCVTAPLPSYFVHACRKLEIPLADELIRGGVRIDDVQQDLSILREGEGTENGMRWLLEPSPLE